MRGGGTSFRRAVAVSVGLHALPAAATVCAGRWKANRPEPPRPAAIDVRVESGPRIEFHVAEVNTAPPQESPASQPDLAKETEPPKPTAPPEPSRPLRPPLATPLQ